MRNQNINRQTTNNFTNSFLVRILFIVLVVFVVFQLYVLTTVGTQGEKVNNLRKQQAQLKVENEIKRAQILQLQSSDTIKNTIADLQLNQVGVQYLDPQTNQISAMK